MIIDYKEITKLVLDVDLNVFRVVLVDEDTPENHIHEITEQARSPFSFKEDNLLYCKTKPTIYNSQFRPIVMEHIPWAQLIQFGELDPELISCNFCTDISKIKIDTIPYNGEVRVKIYDKVIISYVIFLTGMEKYVTFDIETPENFEFTVDEVQLNSMLALKTLIAFAAVNYYEQDLLAMAIERSLNL